RNLVEVWATARGLDLDAESMAKYATETFQDPKVVKATCRKAETAQRAVVERFGELVERAQKQQWTVAKAKAALHHRRRGADEVEEEGATPLFEHAGKGKTRLTVHLDRVRDPSRATEPARADLLELLHALVREIEAAGAAEQASADAGA